MKPALLFLTCANETEAKKIGQRLLNKKLITASICFLGVLLII